MPLFKTLKQYERQRRADSREAARAERQHQVETRKASRAEEQRVAEAWKATRKAARAEAQRVVEARKAARAEAQRVAEERAIAAERPDPPDVPFPRSRTRALNAALVTLYPDVEWPESDLFPASPRSSRDVWAQHVARTLGKHHEMFVARIPKRVREFVADMALVGPSRLRFGDIGDRLTSEDLENCEERRLVELLRSIADFYRPLRRVRGTKREHKARLDLAIQTLKFELRN